MKGVLSNSHWPQRAGFAAKNNPSHIGGGTFALAGPTSDHRPVLQHLAQARSLIMKTGGSQRNLQ